jgi:hypothetical protein
LEFGDELQPGDPDVALRLVTIGDPAFSNQTPSLSWVLVWADSRLDRKGGRGLNSVERGQEIARVSCVFVMVVDATTTQVLDSRQICR